MNRIPENIASLPVSIIIGSPRSGTSFLRNCFDAHPNTVIPTEFPFIPFYSWYFKNKKYLSEKDVLKLLDLINEVFSFDFWTIDRWRIEHVELKENLLSQIEQGLTYADACKIIISCFNSVFPKSDPKILMLKEPLYSSHTKKLLKLFPEIKFIVLHRDPRAQVASVRKWVFGSYLITVNALYWKKTQKKLIRLHKNRPKTVYLLPYEKMISENQMILKDLSAFLGISYDEKMLHFQEKSQEMKEVYAKNNENVIKIGLSSLKKIDKNKISEWETLLSEKEIKLIEHINGRFMKLYGYEKKYPYSFALNFYYIPAYAHYYLQQILSVPVSLLPAKMRIKVIFSSSFFELVLGVLFKKKTKK